ncbi:MAG: ankyrin repeat domain-containing protein [Gemmatimonadota bacterium]|nr:ankyrin repeat domain-containing protein [Gemmatimonadota bacterium]
MQPDSIHEAAGSGDLATLKKIVEERPGAVDQDDEHGWRPIFHAGLRRRFDVVQYLIDRGADLAAHDGYAMHYAAEVPDNKGIVSLLVTYGGLDAHTRPASEVARQFIYSVFLANVGRVGAMLRADSRLAHERYARGDTALHHACRNGDLDIVRQLVAYGADVNATSDNGHFPLYCAAGHGHAETTRYVLDSGADKEAAMADGKTVADWLKQYADQDLRLKACLEILKT